MSIGDIMNRQTVKRVKVMKKSKRYDAEIRRTKEYYQVSGMKWLRIKWVKDAEVR